MAAVPAVVAQRRERSRIAGIEIRSPSRKQAPESGVRRGHNRGSARSARSGTAVKEHRRVSALDPVVRVEYRGVNDGSETLTGRIRRIGRNQCVDEDLVPLEHLVDAGERPRSLLCGFDASGTEECHRGEKNEPTDSAADAHTSPFDAGNPVGRSTRGYNRATQPKRQRWTLSVEGVTSPYK